MSWNGLLQLQLGVILKHGLVKDEFFMVVLFALYQVGHELKNPTPLQVFPGS